MGIMNDDEAEGGVGGGILEDFKSLTKKWP